MPVGLVCPAVVGAGDEARIAAAIEEAGTVEALIAIVTKRLPFYLRLFAAPIVRLTLRLLAQWVSPDDVDPVG